MAALLHTCYRIGDIDRSIAFYSALGFEEMRRMPIGDEAINVFMGLPGEDPAFSTAVTALGAKLSKADGFSTGDEFDRFAELIPKAQAAGAAPAGSRRGSPPCRARTR